MAYILLMVALVAIAFIPPTTDSAASIRKQVSPRSADFAPCVRPDEQRTVQVTLAFEISEWGRPDNVRIVSSDDDCFNEAAMRAVKKWRYRPTIVDRKRVRRHGVETTLTFELGVSA